MNSSDLVELSRQGRTFVAVSEETAQRLQKLRQYLCLPPVQKQEDTVFDCTDVDDIIKEVVDRLDHGVLHHPKFQNDRCFGVMFGEKEFPSLGPNDDGVRSGTKPVELITASGVEPSAFALLDRPLTFGTTHRCAIRVIGTPEEPEAKSPGKHTVEAASPRTQLSKHLLNNHSCHNFNCFGITRWGDRDRDDENVSGARWVGLHWHQHKGSTHISAFGAGMHRNGQPQITPLEVNIKPGDVLGAEVLAMGNTPSAAVWCFFTLNGNRILERNLLNDLPVACKISAGLTGDGPTGSGPHHYEDCQFGVQLSPGVSVALLSLS